MAGPGINIKQFPNVVTPKLTGIIYLVQDDIDYNITPQQLKDLFGIGDVEEWQTKSVVNGTTEFINLGSSLTYGAIVIDYLAKRSGRGYRTGRITLLVDPSTTSGVIVTDYYLNRKDGDVQGLIMDFGRLSSGTIQLDVTADASDANPVILNYQIISKRPITVS